MNSVQSAPVPADVPNSLGAILEPDAALAAARRMQRWYQTPQGVAHSMFGRDGRRVDGRLNTGPADRDDGAAVEAEAEIEIEHEFEHELEVEADE